MVAADIEASQGGGVAESAEEVAQCAICTDDVTDRVHLPCQCKVDYCASCWDRALAKSFNSCAQARCPTCRSPIRVDYNHELDQLVFSRQEEADAETVDQTRQRLAEQLKPRQILILREYGEAHPCPPFQPALSGSADAAAAKDGLKSAAEASPDLEATPPLPPATTATATATTTCAAVAPPAADSAAETTTSSAAAAVAPTSTADVAVAHATELAKAGLTPKCVCGRALELIDVRERARRFLKQVEPWRNNRTIAPLLQQGSMHIVCDLCSTPMSVPKAANGLWVCEAGDGTIKHATSNDLCMDCFILHAWNVDVPAVSAAKADPRQPPPPAPPAPPLPK